MLHHKIAVIFAGGKSSRMLRDKALLPFGGSSSLAEYQYKRLTKYFSKVYIAAKKNKFNFDVHLIEDKYEDSSPLVALVSVFETLTCNEVFVLSVDAPFVSRTVMEKLYTVSEIKADVIVVETSKGLEPLCAIYRRSFLTRAKLALRSNRHRLQSLFDDLEVQKVYVKEEDCFMNLNYPNEYELAKKLIGKED